MIAKCTAGSGGQRVAPAYSLTYLRPPEFHLTPGRAYEVYGFALFRNGPAFLVRNDDRAPEWYATSVFEVLDSAVPEDWRAGRGEGYEFVLGYPELAASETVMADVVATRQDGWRTFARQAQARTSALPVEATPSFAALADLAGHFHQDYDLVADTVFGVVDAYVEGQDDRRTAVLAELDALFAAGLDDVVAHRIWVVEGWAMYDPAVDGLTCLDWLGRVRDRLSA
ncbi:contact-dependent growth inhibition system immunity protein [Amycolatopsis sp. OK19-0408]|uniref:Contact-dependent growth inhibition system immunity protein n=1 Tax=Amycolatopsis iheyensis TaxID=2945988 RepID=A0A9X2SI72_9PSEU|nr:contact-dependent growth inhibition system immunity protein [Amycolatopsis iheyensis]MCR6481526.1 contact-dependent growth inhibition system immunity protein [Amycolatopsis iheyensis]